MLKYSITKYEEYSNLCMTLITLTVLQQSLSSAMIYSEGRMSSKAFKFLFLLYNFIEYQK